MVAYTKPQHRSMFAMMQHVDSPSNNVLFFLKKAVHSIFNAI